MSSREHRRSPRRTIEETVLVSDVMTEEIVGRIGNISEGGLLLIAGVPLADDALYQFRFRLPGLDGGEIETGAHVLWTDRASSPGQSWAGFRFISLSDAHRAFLRAWMSAPGARFD